MTQQPNDAAFWRSELIKMFNDSRFQQFKKFRWVGRVHGESVGIVIANKSPQYTTFALNKGDVEDLIAAKRGGKVDRAFIVAAALGSFVACHDAEEYHASLLANLPLRSGMFGEFWSLTEYEVTGVEEPF
jgi:hypothetical protein